jgi:hypothetical protein
MIREHSQLEALIEKCEEASAQTFFIYKPTYNLITKAVEWSFGKSELDIKKRILICEGKKNRGISILRPQWQLIIDTLKWIIFECDLDPMESRRQLIPLAK